MKKIIVRAAKRARDFALRIINSLLDARDAISGKSSPDVPPRRLSFVGGGDYKEMGEVFLGYFVELCGLKPWHRVMDIGCGIGRMAFPLKGYLDADGSYEGYDIVAKGIKWCNKNLSSRNVRFNVIEAYNGYYNPRGRVPASKYRFPHPDGEFDFIFLISVFTHMFPDDMENYLAEVSRLLKPGGRSFITFFLLNEESLSLMEQGKSTLDFRHVLDGCRTAVPDTPEGALAYEERHIRSLYEKYGLEIDKIYYGFWPGRTEFVTYQDIITSVKPLN